MAVGTLAFGEHLKEANVFGVDDQRAVGALAFGKRL